MNIFGILLSGVDLWLLGVAGACCVLLVPHRLAVARENRARFHVASDNFRSAFNPALAFLEKSRLHGSDLDRPDASAFLRGAFVSHNAAVRQFRPFISRMRRRAYDKAWQKYCELNPADPDSGVMFMVSNRADTEGAVQDRIHAILEFAKT